MSESSDSYILRALPVPSTRMLEDMSLAGDGGRGAGSAAMGGTSGAVVSTFSFPFVEGVSLGVEEGDFPSILDNREGLETGGG